MKDLKPYAKEINEVIPGLPNYRKFMDSDDYAETVYFGFTGKLKILLEQLDAGDVHIYPWTNMAVTVEFQPTKSPYFRLGDFGKSEMNLWYRVGEKRMFDKNLRGTISIGFDDDCDSDYPDDAVPQVILGYFYNRGALNLGTDVDVFQCNNWRYAIAEFFQYDKESDTASIVNRNTDCKQSDRKPSAVMERTIQTSLPI